MSLVTDYRRLNTILDRPVHPFPTTDMIRHSIGSTSRVICKVDLVSAYHQLRIHEDDQELTTFLVPQGRYCYLRAPSKLHEAPAVQEYISELDPTECVGVDLHQVSTKHYLTLVDEASGYRLCYPVRDMTTRSVTEKMEDFCYT